MDVFKLLTSTYSRYVDSESRSAVEEVGTALVRRDELRGTPQGEADESKFGVTEQVLGWMSQEVGRIAKRPRCVHLDPLLSTALPYRPYTALMLPQTRLFCSTGAVDSTSRASTAIPSSLRPVHGKHSLASRLRSWICFSVRRPQQRNHCIRARWSARDVHCDMYVSGSPFG